MIDVKNLTKIYADKKAIDSVSFFIEEGEIVGLLGLNGAGKSTILKILGCFLTPTSGHAFIGGYSIEDEPQAIRGMIGYLADVPPLYGEMTVEDMLVFVAKLKDTPKSEVTSAVDEAIQKTQLGEVRHQLIRGLSHGFRQRVGIAQAIVHKPKVLIFDEPINGLDPVQIVEMRDLILSLRKQHTVILSSHILSEITRTCDRIMIVDQGKVIAEGNELSLRQGAHQQFKIKIQTNRSCRQLAFTKGVHILNEKEIRPGLFQLELDMHEDLRADVARAIVHAGTDLLSLESRGDDLEDLFLKFVKG